MFDPATHRDFLGACLGTGIERSKVGDIIVTGEQGAQLLVAPSMAEHLQVALTQVRAASRARACRAGPARVCLSLDAWARCPALCAWLQGSTPCADARPFPFPHAGAHRAGADHADQPV